jgi:hypothetical protein
MIVGIDGTNAVVLSDGTKDEVCFVVFFCFYKVFLLFI